MAAQLVAALALTSPSPPPGRPDRYGIAVPIRRALARFGVRLGFTWNISAATPDTTAAACEVPVPLK